MASLLVPASLANRLSESERARIDHEAPPIIDGSPPSQNPNLLRQASTSAAFVRKASSRAWEAGVSSPVRDTFFDLQIGVRRAHVFWENVFCALGRRDGGGLGY